jgi:hypothetical protein
MVKDKSIPYDHSFGNKFRCEHRTTRVTPCDARGQMVMCVRETGNDVKELLKWDGL